MQNGYATSLLFRVETAHFIHLEKSIMLIESSFFLFSSIICLLFLCLGNTRLFFYVQVLLRNAKIIC
jgi:hypothetical protein